MGIEIFNVEQNSPEWDELRRGIVTSSEFATVLAKGKAKGESSVTRRRYMMRLAAERLGAEPQDKWTNAHMERGHAMEDDARRLYSFLTGEEPEPIGFVRNGQAGCSPDGLIASRRGALEIKSKLPHLQMEVLFSGEMPSEHVAQVQGQALVGEFEFVDFVSYWPGLDMFIRRTPRDEAYIRNLSGEIARFNDELAEVVEKVRRYGAPSSLKADLTNSLVTPDNILMAG